MAYDSDGDIHTRERNYFPVETLSGLRSRAPSACALGDDFISSPFCILPNRLIVVFVFVAVFVVFFVFLVFFFVVDSVVARYYLQVFIIRPRARLNLMMTSHSCPLVRFLYPLDSSLIS